MPNTAIAIDFAALPQAEVEQKLREYNINLTVAEILKIQNEFLKRPPTLAECVLWSIQGSEHCSYKSTKKYLKKFNTKGPHVILGAEEDAGVVAVAKDALGKRYAVVMSHESHNHPSQIVPYEGAATGVGGNIRDVSCMGAEVVAIANGLRFGDINRAKTHWLEHGVVRGIAGYGNPIGIPNIAGDVYFDAAYNTNCLVTVVTLGIIHEDDIIHSYAPKAAANEDYVFILVGKPTDNSGFGGASFASLSLDETEVEKNKGAVQEPNAFLQRHILKANAALFKILKERSLINKVGFKDLGAGGIACASVELAESGGFGAEIALEHVPTSMAQLAPEVILCSETQERFMWVVPQTLADTIIKHYNETFALPSVADGAKAAMVGKIRHDGQFVVTNQGQILVDAKASAITAGIQYDRPHQAKAATLQAEQIVPPTDFNQTLLALLSHENIASRAPIFEIYDKQVQGRTVLEAGEADAGVLQPFNDDSYPLEVQLTGIALSCDQNPRYNKIDPYWGAIHAVIEAARNVAAVGANPLAITDCLCFGNPEKPEQMAEFVASVDGIIAACAAIKLIDYPQASLPVIAGNVSLYNEAKEGAIPPSPMISCLGAMPNVKYATSFALKRHDSWLLMVGPRLAECGGSVYYQLQNKLGSQLPKPDLSTISNELQAVTSAIQAGFILACHDIADGGIAVAIAEMTFVNEIGVSIDVPGDIETASKLFTESGGFVLEVTKEMLKPVTDHFAKWHVPIQIMGKTTKDGYITMNNVINLPVQVAKHAFLNGLREKLL